MNQRSPTRWIAGLSALITAALGLLALATWALGRWQITTFGAGYIPMALLTGLVFTVLNAGLLLAAAPQKFLSAWRDDLSVVGAPEESRIVTRRLVLSAVVISVLIGCAGFFHLRAEQGAARAAVHGQLDAIANLKAAQIAAWRNERLGEARFLLRTPAVAQDVAALVAQPGDATARTRLHGWLETIKGGSRYESVMVLTPTGSLLTAVPAGVETQAGITRDLLLRAATSQEPLFTDLQRAGPGPALHLDLLVPIRLPSTPANSGASTAADPAIAVVVLRMNPEHFLFPLIRSWPVPSDSAESLLVRREGAEVVFLNPLRHRPGAAMTLRRSVNDQTLPAAMGARGEFGVHEGADYRGIPVLSTLRPIPESHWILVAKIDQTEVYTPIQREAWQTGTVVALLLVAVALAAAFEWRQRHAGFLRRALAVEQERSALAERLALTTQHANDVIILFDEQRRIVEVNERALATYGYTPDEMKQMTAPDLRSEDSAAQTGKDFSSAQNGSGIVFETMHRRKDGTVFSVEVSARPIVIDGRRHVLSIIRDITQRKAHEREIERLNRMYFVVSQVNQAIVHTKTQPELFAEICRVLVELGRFKIAWIGWHDPAAQTLTPVAVCGDRHAYVANLRLSTRGDVPEGRGPSGTAFRENRTHVCNDFQTDPATALWREPAAHSEIRSSIALPLHREGRTVAVLTVYADEVGFFGPQEIRLIEETAGDVSFALDVLASASRRRETEAALRESEERLRLALMAAQQGLYDLNLQTGEATVSAEYAAMLGHDFATFRETNAAWLERLHPDDQASTAAAYRDYVAGRTTEYRVEFRQRTKSGGWKWIQSLGQIVERSPNGVPLRMLGTHTEITGRKQAEQALRDSLREKEALLKEVHHRVKNNLQVITSLLRLEVGRATDGATRAVLHDMKGRILSMALLHESLYRSENLAAVDMSSYLSQLATQLVRGQARRPGAVKLVLDVEPVRLEIDQAIPCGLIVNELASNSLKHGFPEGHSGELRIEVHRIADTAQLCLRVSDNGVGLPPKFDSSTSPSLGLQLVSDLSRQLRGTLTFGAGPGAAAEVRFTPPAHPGGRAVTGG